MTSSEDNWRPAFAGSQTLRLFDPRNSTEAEEVRGLAPAGSPMPAGLSPEQLSQLADQIAERLRPKAVTTEPSPRPTTLFAEPVEPGPDGKTLRDCWGALRRIKAGTQKPATIEEYERCLDRFDEFWVARSETGHSAAHVLANVATENRTTCPVLSTIDDVLLAEFRDWLAAGTGLGRLACKSPPAAERNGSTVAKYFRSLRALLREAVAQQWIGRSPRMPPIRKVAEKQVRVIRPEVISALLTQIAASPPEYPAADYSRGMKPATWWRGLVTLCWHYGFRRGEIIEQLTWRHKDPLLGTVGVFFERQSPIESVDLANEWGWIVYSPTKQEWSKPGVLLLPLTAACRAVLDQIRHEQGLGPNDWPHTLLFPAPRSHPARDRVFKALQQSAGVTSPYTLHDLRRTCETFWENFGLGEFVTGHAGRTTHDRSYDSKVTRLLSLLPTLASRPDYPAAFAREPPSFT